MMDRRRSIVAKEFGQFNPRLQQLPHRNIMMLMMMIWMDIGFPTQAILRIFCQIKEIIQPWWSHPSSAELSLRRRRRLFPNPSISHLAAHHHPPSNVKWCAPKGPRTKTLHYISFRKQHRKWWRWQVVRFPNCIVYYQSRGWGTWLG